MPATLPPQRTSVKPRAPRPAPCNNKGAGPRGAGRGVQPSQALQSSEKALEATSAFKTDSLRT